MKHLLFFFLIAFVSTVGYSQDIPDKANTITITLADSATAPDKVKKAFTSRDFEVKVDKTGTTITTVGRTLKGGARVGYTAQLNGKEVLLTGKVLVAGQSSMTIVYGGKKGTPFMDGWEEMDKIAKALAGKVKYEKK